MPGRFSGGRSGRRSVWGEQSQFRYRVAVAAALAVMLGSSIVMAADPTTNESPASNVVADVQFDHDRGLYIKKFKLAS